MKQKEILQAKSFEEIMTTAKIHNIRFPGGLKKNERQALYSLFGERAGNTLGWEYYAEYGIRDSGLRDNIDEFNAKQRREIMKHREQEMRMAEIVRKAIRERDTLEDMLCDYLLDARNMKQILSRCSLQSEALFRDTAERTLDESSDVNETDLISNQRFMTENLESAGYYLLRKKMYYETADERTHITGIQMGTDAAQLFRTLDTEEYRISRETEEYISGCINMAVRYYYIAPLSMILRLYEVIRERKPYLPELSEQDIVYMIVDYPDMMFAFKTFEYNDALYITPDFLAEILEDEEEDAAEAYMKDIAEADCDYYIPSYEEMLEFFDLHYLSSNAPLVKVREFVYGAFDEKRALNNMGTGMFTTGASAEERMQFRKNMYSADDAEDEAIMQFYYAVQLLYEDQDGSSVFQNMYDFTEDFSDEAKDDFRRMLIECEPYMPKYQYLGHSQLQYQALKEAAGQKEQK